eukprot:3645211-Rhodomonas_salina.1
MAHINLGNAQFYASWIQNGILADTDRKEGRVGAKGELLRKRPVQTSLHTAASPRRFMERKEGIPRPRVAFEQRHRVDYITAKLTDGKTLQLADIQPQRADPRDRPKLEVDRVQSVFTRDNRIRHGDALLYTTRIEIPRLDIKSRPVTARDRVVLARPTLAFTASYYAPEHRAVSRGTFSSSSSGKTQV